MVTFTNEIVLLKLTIVLLRLTGDFSHLFKFCKVSQWFILSKNIAIHKQNDQKQLLKNYTGQSAPPIFFVRPAFQRNPNGSDLPIGFNSLSYLRHKFHSKEDDLIRWKKSPVNLRRTISLVKVTVSQSKDDLMTVVFRRTFSVHHSFRRTFSIDIFWEDDLINVPKLAL